LKASIFNKPFQLEAKLLMSVKIIMTDRHTVNKSYKTLLEIEKETKIDGLDIEMTEEERDSACSVNGLFCGLHIVPLEFANNHSFQRRIYFDLPNFSIVDHR
jgi:hypothetical protein